MHGEDISIRLMQPGQNQNVLTRCDAVETGKKPGLNLQPCVRRSLEALLRRLCRLAQGRVDSADRDEGGSHRAAVSGAGWASNRSV